MAVLTHYNRSKVKKKSSAVMQKTKANKEKVISLLFLEYHLFLKHLLEAANTEARNSRSKVTRGEHVKAVSKKILAKFKK